jgi:galactokinase/mevalonate kinase-like predicted kinase
MIYRSKAPLRIGLAGGGTDVSPYSDQFGGAILKCNRFAVCLCQYSALGRKENNCRSLGQERATAI